MKKIKLITPLWNRKPGDELNVTDEQAAFAIRKNKAVEVVKVRKAPKNKAEVPKNNK